MTTVSLTEWLGPGSLGLALCWLLYYGLLRRATCLRFNRAFLLLTPVLAALAPLLPRATGWPAAPVSAAVGHLLPALPPLTAAPALPGPTAAVAAPARDWLLLLYAVGVAGHLLVLGGQLLRLGWRVRRLPVAWRQGYTLRLTGGRLPTSSFGRTVLWDDTQALTAAEAEQVLLHEQAHVHQGHSADRLWLRLWQAVFWFHPAAYLYGRALALTHEYLADAAVLAEAPAAAPAYARLLARQAARAWVAPSLLPAFATPRTLHRLAMLHRLPLTPSRRPWLALPAAGLALAVAACEQPDATPNAAAAGPVYAQVAQMPQAGGETSDLLRQVVKRCRYPREAQAAGVHGTIIVGFVVGADGRLRDVEVQQSLLEPLDQQVAMRGLREAAVQAVRTLPARWQPGRHAGQPVAVGQTLTLTFGPCAVLEAGAMHPGTRIMANWRPPGGGGGFYYECRPQ